ncbi:hypothetical protein HAP41_0000015880 [Bradyrhizobium barranii subsp. apii]|uniref:Uncharacterized protein n=1 Tax=Bradyrhizobium barranii subsp. apii TaxID=2819348 RepID=A0A8T5VD44_9BRAD|nr:hypothetical protein [Bradyrhizobium barranii]UPT90289.1 hypothetical protein HAP41_0000015880 [Bradyrhizobium barranii subsp. apii]
MKLRPPVDFHLIGVDQIAPPFQAVLRYAMCPGIGLHAQSTPPHRFNVHCPERLDGSAALVLRHWTPLLAKPLPTFLATQFRTYFQRFGVNQMPQPAIECAVTETMLTTVFALAETASPPRLNVYRPKRATRFVLEIFRTHRRSSNAARNPIWNDNALSESRAGFGRLRYDGRWRDKRGSPVEPQAIGMAWVLACRSVGTRAALCVLGNAIKDIFGTVGAFAPFEGRI